MTFISIIFFFLFFLSIFFIYLYFLNFFLFFFPFFASIASISFFNLSFIGKMSPRVPISAAEIAKLIEAMGADRVMCVDLHSGQEQGFFNIPVDNLEAQNVAVKYFIKKIKKSTLINDQFVILSPDAGGVSRAKSF